MTTQRLGALTRRVRRERLREVEALLAVDEEAHVPAHVVLLVDELVLVQALSGGYGEPGEHVKARATAVATSTPRSLPGR